VDALTGFAGGGASSSESSLFDLVLQQHRQIEATLERVGTLRDVGEQQRAWQQLLMLIIVHNNAEEIVLYPALALLGEHRGPADHQSEWLHLTELHGLDPTTARFESVFGTLRTNLLTHIHVEETSWMPALQKRAQGKLQQRLARDFCEQSKQFDARFSELVRWLDLKTQPPF
jgi:hypothetical protein